MTSSSSTPDIAAQVATLSLGTQPQQRLHDTYDFDGGAGGNGRNPYHFSTSPPIPAQSQYNPLGMNQSPLKNKASRAALPSVSLLDSATPADDIKAHPLLPCLAMAGRPCRYT